MDDAFEERTIVGDTSKYAHGNGRRKQASREVLAGLANAHRTRTLRTFHGAAKAVFYFLEAGSDVLCKFSVEGRNFHGGVDQQATATIGERGCDQIGEERVQCRERVGGGVKLRHPEAGRSVEIALECAREQSPLVAEGVVQARATELHVGGEVSYRRRAIAPKPETLNGRVKNCFFIKGSVSPHGSLPTV